MKALEDDFGFIMGIVSSWSIFKWMYVSISLCICLSKIFLKDFLDNIGEC